MAKRNTSKYEPKHIDLYDSSLNAIITDGLHEDIIKTHRVAELFRRKNGNWIVRLEYDFAKDSHERSKIQF